ncbi:hypothetical protein B0F90DRAFT_1636115 [Multifurca ochricompacta]|uniref:Protein N-terminal and lysine N-methyltransferase EFM7 n=1 Tax=Multifurca ochricompacta TaxID=376703 RepID=A0AAD4M1V1_9AGAM|nr:hypothetical protein B0F90DRAFT_1636115 [Multifurca ochricompacta]
MSSSVEGDDGNLSLDSIFIEPPRPPSPEPTIAVRHSRQQSSTHWKTIVVRLIGSHPLWGHYLWNASRSLATYLQRAPELYDGRTVLELGAGGGLPSLVVAKCGARKVVLTDYPDKALVDNMIHNVERNVEPERRDSIHVLGYIWGRPVEPLLLAAGELVKDTDTVTPGSESGLGSGSGSGAGAGGGFDLILLSDLIFNHSQHRALLTTCEGAIAPDGCVLVFYTHHRPHLAQRDMEFFELANETGWKCEKVWTERFPPMFPEDSGEEEIRSTVHGWKVTRGRDVV